MQKFENAMRLMTQVAMAYNRDATELREKDPAQSFALWVLAEEMVRATEALKRQEPEEPEMEGGGTTWWYVCQECHGAIDRSDHYCRHCGQAVAGERVTETSKGVKQKNAGKKMRQVQENRRAGESGEKPFQNHIQPGGEPGGG